MAPVEFVVKVDLDGDIRRFRLQASAAGETAWAALNDEIRGVFELAEGVELRLTYEDGEGDDCTLTAATLADCFALASAGTARLRGSICAPTAAAAMQHRAAGEVIDAASGPDAPCMASSRDPAPRKDFARLGFARSCSALAAQSSSPAAKRSSQGRGEGSFDASRAVSGLHSTSGPDMGMTKDDTNIDDVRTFDGMRKGTHNGKSMCKGKGKRKMMWRASAFAGGAAKPLADRIVGGQEVADEAGAAQPWEAPKQCRSPGPWKVLACLGGMRAAEKLSTNAMASLAVHFLPMLAVRAGRRQALLNENGAARRELLLPALHRAMVHLEALEGAGPVKQSLEAYCSGTDTSKFGQTLAALLQLLRTHPDRAGVVALIKGVSEELVDLLPVLFPRHFVGGCSPAAAHAGARCGCCAAEPIVGPRFHDAASGVDFCCECFGDQVPGAAADFECQLWSIDPKVQKQACRESFRKWAQGAALWQTGAVHRRAQVWWPCGTGGVAEHEGKGQSMCKGKGKSKMMRRASAFAACVVQPGTN